MSEARFAHLRGVDAQPMPRPQRRRGQLSRLPAGRAVLFAECASAPDAFLAPGRSRSWP